MKRRPIRRRSKKGQAYEAEYQKMAKTIRVRSAGRCEILAAHACDGPATLYPHHRKMRSQGGSNDIDNLIDVCWTGHMWIHNMPRLEAYELQLIVPRDFPEYPYRP